MKLDNRANLAKTVSSDSPEHPVSPALWAQLGQKENPVKQVSPDNLDRSVQSEIWDLKEISARRALLAHQVQSVQKAP